MMSARGLRRRRLGKKHAASSRVRRLSTCKSAPSVIAAARVLDIWSQLRDFIPFAFGSCHFLSLPTECGDSL